MNFVTSKQFQETLGISSATLMNWKNTGKVIVKKISNKKYLYDLDSVDITTNNNKLDIIIQQNNEIIKLLKNTQINK